MIEKTEAIVLRCVPFSETSRMVVWFTQDHGKVTTAIKGSQRAKSMFIGQYDLFYTCELLYYQRETDHVHAIKECSPLHMRTMLRSNWKACAAASYMADLFSRFSPARAHQPGLYELLAYGLDHAPLVSVNPTFLFWFELSVLRRLGLAPRLTTPNQAGAPGNGGTATLHLGSGSVRHDDQHRSADEQTLVIPPDILAILVSWQKARTPQTAMATRCSAVQLGHIETVLGQFLRYHLESALESREIALDTIRRKIA